MTDHRPPRPTILAWVPVPLLAAVATVLSWPGPGLQPQAGLDPSWIMGLHLAGDAGLHLGTDVVFTFGPLGPLTRPVAIDAAAFLPGLVLRFAVIAATAWLVARHTRRLAGPRWGILATLVLTPLLVLPYGRGADPEIAVVLYVVALLAALDRPPSRWTVPAGLLGAALLLFAKVSAGLTALGLWGLWTIGIALARSRRRARPADGAAPVEGAGGQAASPSWAWAWLVAAPLVLVGLAVPFGFSPGGFADYLGNSLELTLGFAAAMHDAHAQTLRHLAAFALALVPLAAATVLRLRSAERDRDAAALVGEVTAAVLLLAFAFTRFKYGFTREGPGHLVPAVTALVLLTLVRAPDTWRDRPARWAGALVASVVAVAVVLAPARAWPWNVVQNAGDWGDDLLAFVSSDDRADGRLQVLADYGITDEVRPGPGTIHLDPWDIAAVWGLDRVQDWTPPPVFQTYQAYTPLLDGLNARFLAGEGPDWILRQPKMIDGRNAAWDPPRSVLALACWYDEVATAPVPASARLQGPPWTLLQRRDAPRCDPLAAVDPATSLDTTLGEWFDVPSAACEPGPATLAVEVDRGGLGTSMRALAWVPPVWRIEAELDDGSTTSWRWLPTFSGEPMLLGVPDDVRWALRGSSAAIRRLRVVRADDVLQGGPAVTASFGCLS